MQFLPLTPEIKKDIDGLVEFASRPENRYKPGVSEWVPGDRKEFVRDLFLYRLVFSLTEAPDGSVYRQMSLSYRRREKLPNEIATFTIAAMCGFTGGKTVEGATTSPGPDWQIQIDRHPTEFADACIVIVQRVTDA